MSERMVQKITLPHCGEVYVANADEASFESMMQLQLALQKLYEYEQAEAAKLVYSSAVNMALKATANADEILSSDRAQTVKESQPNTEGCAKTMYLGNCDEGDCEHWSWCGDSYGDRNTECFCRLNGKSVYRHEAEEKRILCPLGKVFDDDEED